MHHIMKTSSMITLLTSALVISACGGNNTDNNTPAPVPKDMAMTQDQGTDMPGTPDMPIVEVDMPDTPDMPIVEEDMPVDMPPAQDMPLDMPSTDPDPTCENYCDVVTTNCTGDDAQYESREACLSYCEAVGGWEEGMKGDTSGDTIACRIYHGGVAAGAPTTHCDHAGPTGGNVCGSWCDVYCNLGFEHCSAANELYDTEAECQATCATFDDSGSPGDIEYDTVQCRIYHLGSPAASMPDTHCSHGGETPTDFCLGSPDDFIFSTDAPATYTRYDRMGMPAVSTALISDKVGYNNQDPIDDAASNNPYVGEIVNNLTGLHAALDDDLTGATLTPCSMSTTTNGLPSCLGQRVSQGGPIVASLAVPDHITIDPSQSAGFPNGRLLADPVMDVTLAILLLDMSAHTPLTLAGLPLNPPRNDVGVEGAFLQTFPYLHPPHN